MVRIVSDTSTMYSPSQAQAAGFAVAPLSVTIAGKSYKELEEIQLEEFVSIIGQGHMPTSSQPALGDVMAMYEACGQEEIINISMADGLSGTYSTAVAAARSMEGQNIEVVNTGTLCGPHRYMVEVATKMAHAGMDIKSLQYLMGHSDAGVTMNVYTHATYDHAEATMQKILQLHLPEEERKSG